MLKNSKQDLRERILTLLGSQEEKERLNKSLSITNKLFKMQEFKTAKTILFYSSFKGEVLTFEMIKEAQKLGKKIALPKILKSQKQFVPVLIDNIEQDLVQGSYGIKEPKDNAEQIEPQDLDLVVVPGVAFDKNNNRLGRGGGYYDRFLQSLPSTTPTIGLAFDFQIVDSVPDIEKHDKSVSCVLAN